VKFSQSTPRTWRFETVVSELGTGWNDSQDAFDARHRQRRLRRRELTLYLSQKPFFCCCCLALGPSDARRARRVFRLVAAITRDW